MKRLLCVLVTVLVGVRAGAEPFLNRNVASLDPGRTSVAIGGSWGASRGAFDDQGALLGQRQGGEDLR